MFKVLFLVSCIIAFTMSAAIPEDNDLAVAESANPQLYVGFGVGPGPYGRYRGGFGNEYGYGSYRRGYDSYRSPYSNGYGGYRDYGYGGYSGYRSPYSGGYGGIGYRGYY